MNKLVDKTNVFHFFCYQSALPSLYLTYEDAKNKL